MQFLPDCRELSDDDEMIEDLGASVSTGFRANYTTLLK